MSTHSGHEHTSGTPVDPVPVFAALGDPTRLDLITRLCDGQPRSISQLTEGLNLSRQGVTKHLRVLEKAGIVGSSRIGRESRFTFCPQPVEDVHSYLGTVCRQWDEAIQRLRAMVEE